MFDKRTKIYARKKTHRFLGPLLIILIVSLVAAVGGTYYWDKYQKDRLTDPEVLANVKAEVPKKTSDPKSTDDSVTPSETGLKRMGAGNKNKEENTPTPPPAPTDMDTNPNLDDETTPVDAPPADTTPADPNVSPALVPESSPPVGDEYFADAAFVGDSITEGISLYSENIDTTVVAAKGINLDTIYKEDAIRTPNGYVSVLQRLQQAAPKKIYIMFGSNGVGWFTQEHFSKTYGDFVDKVVAQHPESQIYLQSITPVTQNYAANPENNIDNNKINEYNKLIIAIAEQKDLHYVDVASVLRGEDGALPEEQSGDGMHFGRECYNKWFGYLKSHVATEE